jgi:16S rRNA G527 N7-methylase RsmG
MTDSIDTWAQEVRRYNRRLHLVSAAMEKSLEPQARDAMEMMHHIPEKEIADLGSGSGILGIPFKIMIPGSSVSLIERAQKKCIFLRHVIDLLSLKDMDVIEADPIKEPIRRFEALMSRSFSPRENLTAAAAGCLSSPGRFYYFSTGESEPLTHPWFTIMEIFSRDCPGYRLNLEVYSFTSR